MIDLLTIYFIFVTPVFIVFRKIHNSAKPIEFILDLVYLADILRQFFTAEHGEKSLKKMV